MSDPLQSLARIVGERHVITDAAALAPYLEEVRGRYTSECLAVVRPADRGEVAAVVETCAAAALAIVPQGGNTGVVGGAVARPEQILLNLGRLNQVAEVDAVNHTMRVQAGCILADVQASAARHDRLFPLDLGARGSCQIGGNIATNAGGINVLHYGNTRDLVLGLEVVLADGRVWDGMNGLRKNNSGYDMKNLFIGSEGTLGIITAATLKLFPPARTRVVALAGVKDADAALALLGRVKDATSDRVTTFELMADIALRAAIRHLPGLRDPLSGRHPWYVLLVAGSSHPQSGLRAQVEDCLGAAMAAGELQDATIAAGNSQAQGLIALREGVVEAQQFEGGSVKHDVSVAVAKVPALLRRAAAAVLEVMPTARLYPYGHMGDGNIHFNISQPPDMDTTEFLAQREALSHAVHEATHALGGSFSAEHGIGIARLAPMRRYKDPISLALYRQVKTALDPNNLLNPGKLHP